MKQIKTSIALASAVILAVGAQFAGAIPTLFIDFGDDGTVDVTIADESAADTGGASIAGLVNGTAFAFNPLRIVSLTGATMPALGTSTSPELAETTLVLQGTGKIAIYFTEFGYGPTNQNYNVDLAVTTLAPTALISYYTYATTTPFTAASAFTGAGTPMTSLALSTVDGISGNGTLPFNGSSALNYPFALTQKIIINQPNGGSTAMSANLQLPDGGTTTTLLGISLLGLYGARRKFGEV